MRGWEPRKACGASSNSMNALSQAVRAQEMNFKNDLKAEGTTGQADRNPAGKEVRAGTVTAWPAYVSEKNLEVETPVQAKGTALWME